MGRNNLIRKTLMFVLLLAISFQMVGKIPKAYAFVTDQNIVKETDVVISRKATIDDNFTEDALLITLTHDTIFDFKQYTTLDFPELNLVSVTEITEELYSRLEQQIKN